nr:hypothetical protein [Tanacetum cinerariifolium]
MQQTINELTAFCTSLQRQHSELLAKFQAQEVEINRLKERVKLLEDKGVIGVKSGDDAPIKGRSTNDGEGAAERIMVTSSGFIPTAGPPATVISTGSEVGPTASLIVPRRKGKEVMVESDTPKKKKLQEQIDAQVARELEEQQEREDMRMNEQIARDAEVARIHAEKEIQESTEKANVQEAEEGVLYGCNQKQLGVEVQRFQRKGINLEKEQVKKQKSSEEAPETKTSTEEFTEDKIKEIMQLVLVEDVYVQALQVKHPIIDWKVHSEGKRSYWQIIRLGGSSACYQFFVDLLRQLDREDLNQLWALVKEYLSSKPASSDKEMELWVELKRMYE